MVFDKDPNLKQKEEKLKYEQRRDNPKPKRDKIRNKREHSESDSEDDRRPRKKGKLSNIQLSTFIKQFLLFRLQVVELLDVIVWAMA